MLWKKIRKALINRIYTLILKIELYAFGVKFGKGLFVMNAYPCIEIYRGNEGVFIGNNLTINGNNNCTAGNAVCRISVAKDGFLKIGNNVGMNGVNLFCSKSIAIGNNTIIGGGTKIFDTNFHSLDYMVRRDKKRFNEGRSAAITIEDDVFIGTNCIIEKGVRIGARSIIAAGSVVVKDVPPDCVAGGNPCKVIKIISKNEELV